MIQAQYMRFHRFWSHGGKSADGAAAQFQGFGDEDSGVKGDLSKILSVSFSRNECNELNKPILDNNKHDIT